MKKNSILAVFVLSNCYAGDDIPSNFVKRGIGYFDVPNTTSSKSLEVNPKSPSHERYINYLLKLDSEQKFKVRQSNISNDPRGTDIQSSLNHIKLNFPFDFTLTKDVVGFAPVGEWTEGWSGVKVFFRYPNVGICAFTEDHVKSVMFPRQRTSYLINNHPTSKMTSSSNGKHLYVIAWAKEKQDAVISNMLECVNLTNNSIIFDDMIKISKELDKLS